MTTQLGTQTRWVSCLVLFVAWERSAGKFLRFVTSPAQNDAADDRNDEGDVLESAQRPGVTRVIVNVEQGERWR